MTIETMARRSLDKVLAASERAHEELRTAVANMYMFRDLYPDQTVLSAEKTQRAYDALHEACALLEEINGDMNLAISESQDRERVFEVADAEMMRIADVTGN